VKVSGNRRADFSKNLRVVAGGGSVFLAVANREPSPSGTEAEVFNLT
jgi:hypothetical protein